MPENFIAGLGSAAQFQLDELIVSYDDGKVLTFSEIPNSTYAQPSYQLDQWVQFSQDLGNGTFYFKGKIREREHVAAIQQERIQYTAYGIQRLANDCFIRDTNGRPEIYITPTATTVANTALAVSEVFHGPVITGTTIGTIAITSLSATPLYRAVSILFGKMATVLKSEGISDKFSIAGLKNNPPTTLPGTIVLQGGFVNALQELVSFEPGVKPIFDEVDNTWKFVNMMEAPVVRVTINSDNVGEHNVRWSVANRFTAVRLIAPKPDISLKNFRKPWTYKVNVEAIPAWNISLEPTWTRNRGATQVLSITPSNVTSIQGYYNDPDSFIYGSIIQAGDSFPNAYWHVYRTYYLNYGNGAPHRGEGLITYVDPYTDHKVTVEANIIQGPFSGTDPRYRNTGLFAVAKEPIVIAGEPDAPGGAIGTNSTAITSEKIPWRAVSIYSSAYATLEFEANQAFILNNTSNELRYPTKGFEGNAFTFFKIQREKIVEVQPDQLNVATAKSILKVYQDAIVTGEVPIEGPPLYQFMNLGKRMKLEHGSLSTAIASIYVMVTEYRYQFGKRGVNNVSFSTDYSGLIRNA